MKKRWFTLIEMLIVIVIIGILAVALIPRIWNARDRAADVARMADVRSIATALISYRLDHGSYPETTSRLINDEVDYWLGWVIPTDPDDESVDYWYSILDEGRHFIVCAHLSNGSKAGNANQDFCNSDRGIKEIPTNTTKPKKSGLSSRFAPEVHAEKYAEFKKEYSSQQCTAWWDYNYWSNEYNNIVGDYSYNRWKLLYQCYIDNNFNKSLWDNTNAEDYLYCPGDSKYNDDEVVIEGKKTYIFKMNNRDDELVSDYKSAWNCSHECFNTYWWNEAYTHDFCEKDYMDKNNKKCGEYWENFYSYIDNWERKNSSSDWYNKYEELIKNRNTAGSCMNCYEDGNWWNWWNWGSNSTHTYKEILKELGKIKWEYYIYAY